MKRAIGILICAAAVVVVLVLAFGYMRKPSPSHADSPKIILPMPQGNQAPTRGFLDDYREYEAAQKELDAMLADKGIKRKQHEVMGMIANLNREIPQGYGFDETTMSFKPLKSEPAPNPLPLPYEPKPKAVVPPVKK